MIRDWLFERRSDLANPDPVAYGRLRRPDDRDRHPGQRRNGDEAHGGLRRRPDPGRDRRHPAADRLSAGLENDGKERATDYFLYRLLHDQPNEEQTSVEFREMLQGHLALRGNAYAQIDRKMGKPARLVPLHPDRVEVARERTGIFSTGSIRIREARTAEPAAGRDHAHPRAFLGRGQGDQPDRALPRGDGARPGLRGVQRAPVRQRREHQRGARNAPGDERRGALAVPDALAEELRRVGNAGKTAILEQGMKWQAIGIAPKDAEFIVSRKFQVTEIARIFRVPPHMLADLERATFSNIEHQSLEFIRDTIRPWLVRWEQALTRDLIPPEDRDTYFVEFLIDGLMRGDLKSRYDSYAIGRNNGWLSANDIRRLENMNPLPPEQGDVYLIPLNMMPAGTASPEPSTNRPRGRGGRIGFDFNRIQPGPHCGLFHWRECSMTRKRERRFTGNCELRTIAAGSGGRRGSPGTRRSSTRSRRSCGASGRRSRRARSRSPREVRHKGAPEPRPQLRARADEQRHPAAWEDETGLAVEIDPPRPGGRTTSSSRSAAATSAR